MTLPRPLAALVAAALAATSLAVAAPAYADFDITPSACDARLGPWDLRAVYSTDNPNPTLTYVEFGNDNLFLESPNFREEQPSEFAPGYHEGLFRYVSDPRSLWRGPRTSWYVQGALAQESDQGCDGRDAPLSTTPPQFTQDPVGGAPVEVDPGTWTGGGPGGVWRAAWLEACAEHGCRRVTPQTRTYTDVDPAATTLSLPVPLDLAGERLRAVVATYSWRGVALAASTLSAPVSGSVEPSAPTPSWSGFDFQRPHVVGGTIVTPVSRLEWGGFPQPELSFSWERCPSSSPDSCVAIPGAAGLSHRLTPDDATGFLRVVVTAANASGTATSATEPIAVSPLDVSSVSRAVTFDAPTVDGTAQVGEPLTVLPGDWISTEPLRYQWQRCAATCADLRDADSASYVPTGADVGSSLRAVVIATGAVSERPDEPVVTRFATAPTAPVAAAPTPPAPPAPPAPVVTPPPPVVAPPSDVAAPRLTGVRITPARLRVGRSASLRLALDEAAALRVDVRRPRSARVVLTLGASASAGSQRILVVGRKEQRRLAPGRYVLTVVATDASGNRSAPVLRSFTVVR